jgi:hypothetical protein
MKKLTNNLVAKYSIVYNKHKVERDRKKTYVRKEKHKFLKEERLYNN